MRAVQEGVTSIRVLWTPPSPLGDTIGYRISYSINSSTSSSLNVSGGSTNQSLLTGLLSGETYTISVAGLSQSFPSNAITLEIPLGKLGD